ncbi:MAG: sigma-70 family RNA polymerase sigma factor [Oscillospiraceae bacterium]|nr:sigma-70 family RNA polymerase sigma factor [Oscillospiraceae bacterium]
MEDKAIISLYIDRSEQAISETDRKYGKYLRKIAENILGDKNDTEECLNDTYLKVWNAIPPHVPIIFRAFAAKIARNTALNIYEKRKASMRFSGQLDLSLDELADCFEDDEDIEACAERKETISALNEFLEGLDKKKRICFMQRYFYMESIKNIAEMNNISESALKTMLCRTRADLKEFIKERGLY